MHPPSCSFARNRGPDRKSRTPRWFLVVGGGLSGTVAKTISAYDKEVSDDLYGSGIALRIPAAARGHAGPRMEPASDRT